MVTNPTDAVLEKQTVPFGRSTEEEFSIPSDVTF
jgi:hypothetical protein